jgi:glutathione transport system permease protein
MAWATVAGLLIGVFSATRRGRWPDYGGMIAAVSGISLPSFWLGLLLIDLFSVQLHWLPTGGYGSWRSFFLPSFTLGLGVAAVVARFTRSAFLEIAREDYIRTARAKGVLERVVVWKHTLRNALIPVITMVGLQFGFLLGGSIVVETVFSWPGLGRLLVDSVSYRDYPVIQAEILLFSLEFILINLLVDVLYALANPEIRYK